MNSTGIVAALVALVVGALGGYVIGQGQNKSSTTGSEMVAATAAVKSTPLPKTDADKIANAISAAPADIAKDASVLDWPETATGTPREIHKGTNEWTCLPDTPTTPGNDPICADNMAMQWFQAYLGHTTPKIAQAGIAYMLQGGSDPSNTDPYATEPKSGESWMNAPAHVMVFPSGKLDTKVYGTAMNGGPWIMWAGTPYEHLMVPVM